MPGVSAEMLDWWFDWHPRDPLRYRIWFPQDHFDISFEPATKPGAKPFYNTIHHPVEDVGLGRDRIRIEFLDPVEFGFPEGSVPSENCATIVCGHAGDDKRRVRHTRMCHFARGTDDGIELRSRFWIGERIEFYSGIGRADHASAEHRVGPIKGCSRSRARSAGTALRSGVFESRRDPSGAVEHAQRVTGSRSSSTAGLPWRPCLHVF